jgi:hypothetical protein
VESPLELLEKLNSFYSTAFGHLMTITLAVFAFSGVILPIVFQFIQAALSITKPQAECHKNVLYRAKMIHPSGGEIDEGGDTGEMLWMVIEKGYAYLVENKLA